MIIVAGTPLVKAECPRTEEQGAYHAPLYCLFEAAARTKAP
jgi:hypothetical protein